jgi:hypothetical protein
VLDRSIAKDIPDSDKPDSNNCITFHAQEALDTRKESLHAYLVHVSEGIQFVKRCISACITRIVEQP